MANIKTNSQGYNYKYTDLAGINEYIESIEEWYYQYIAPVDGVDYVWTKRFDKDGKEIADLCGSRIVNAVLSGKSNPAQEWGSATTYARRYSLLMAYGLATEDDDAESLTRKPEQKSAKYVPSKSKPRTDDQKLIIINLLRQHAISVDDMPEYLADKYGIVGDMSEADAQMVIDDLDTKEK